MVAHTKAILFLAPNAKPALIWALSLPVTLVGMITWLDLEYLFRLVGSFIGFLTSLSGLAIGICGLIWWVRRLRKDQR